MFATRTLTIKNGDSSTPVGVAVGCPIKADEGEFACIYSISWPETPWEGTAYGFDGVQALLIAMNMIAAQLYHSTYDDEGRLLWGGEENGYGFPLSATIRNVAQGADRFL